jgi:poly(ADP-ribose) glycohydrolase ARH3
MYTDDTQSTLALASSLAANGRLDARHVARSYAEFFKHEPLRGYPSSAQAVLAAVERGDDIATTGRVAFTEGSFANGAAMRISPVGIAFRNAPDDVLREACRLAVISSHVHPEAVDGAFLIAKAISMALALPLGGPVDVGAFLATLHSLSANKEVSEKVKWVIDNHQSLAQATAGLPWAERMAKESAAADVLGGSFQIRTSEAVGVVLLAFALHWSTPMEAISACIAYGGDTDTTASILAGILGALHGRSWLLANLIDELENNEFGRDYAIGLAHQLAALDLRSVEPQGL